MNEASLIRRHVCEVKESKAYIDSRTDRSVESFRTSGGLNAKQAWDDRKACSTEQGRNGQGQRGTREEDSGGGVAEVRADHPDGGAEIVSADHRVTEEDRRVTDPHGNVRLLEERLEGACVAPAVVSGKHHADRLNRTFFIVLDQRGELFELDEVEGPWSTRC